jgi:glycosyltransferase involved in cell wall biosynthesis
MNARRFLLVDQNIRASGGHFLELASVILSAAEEQGYEPWLVTNSAFKGAENVRNSWTVRSVFSHYKMQRWSLTAYGHSRVARDGNGRPEMSGLQSILQVIKDRIHQVRPEVMLDDFATELVPVLKEFKPTDNDKILFATCDDFCALAIAEAFRRADLPASVDLHILSHASFLEQRECEWAANKCNSPHFARQIALTRKNLLPHRVHFWATTEELARQLNWVAGVPLWAPVCYPVRNSLSPMKRDSPVPRRILLGGAIRSEKGLSRIAKLVGRLWDTHLESGRWQIAMQVPENLHSSVLPRNLLSKVAEWAELGDKAPVILSAGHLDSESYERMLQTADLGLFLYDGRRYYTRCSGVLVEMLACGIPVIVPAASWLSRQIAPAHDRYLRNVECQFAKCICIHEKQLTLPVHQRAAYSFMVTVPSAGLTRIAVTLDETKEFDYLAVEVCSLAKDGRTIRSDLRILECSVIEPTQFLVNTPINASSLKICLWSPYPQRPISVRRIELFHSDDAGISVPISSLGLTDSGASSISQNIDEIENHYLHYRDSATQYADAWRRRHSGNGLVETLQQDRNCSACNQAELSKVAE